MIQRTTFWKSEPEFAKTDSVTLILDTKLSFLSLRTCRDFCSARHFITLKTYSYMRTSPSSVHSVAVRASWFIMHNGFNIIMKLVKNRGWCIKFATGLNGRFLAILLLTTLISFTNLWFRRSFWGAEQFYILFGSKLMPQIQKTKKPKESAKSIKNMSAFLQSRKNPET